MTLFVVRRKYEPYVPPEQVEQMMTLLISSGTWFPAVAWQRSYFWETAGVQESLCVYEGPSREGVYRHGTYCGLPATNVAPVEEWLPGSETGLLSRDISAENTPAAPDDRYFAVERTFDPALAEDEIGGAWLRSGQCAAEIPRLYWVRTYWSEEDRKAWCIFRAPNAELVAQHSRRSVLPADWIQEVSENHPRDWGHIYNAFGLPRHWEGEARSVWHD